MKTILENYIKQKYNHEEVFVKDYIIIGCGCTVNYSLDDSMYFLENTTINIWEMLIYLNK